MNRCASHRGPTFPNILDAADILADAVEHEHTILRVHIHEYVNPDRTSSVASVRIDHDDGEVIRSFLRTDRGWTMMLPADDAVVQVVGGEVGATQTRRGRR